jgi:hypothetical protein
MVIQDATTACDGPGMVRMTVVMGMQLQSDLGFRRDSRQTAEQDQPEEELSLIGSPTIRQ